MTKLRGRLLALPLILLLAGCRGIGTQQFTAFAPSQAEALAATSRTVLDVRCALLMARADYSFRENLHMLAPMPQRWKCDMDLEVERVVVGEFSEGTLRLHCVRNPTPAQSETLGIAYRGGCGFTNGMPLRIGFKGRSRQHVRDLRLLIRQER